MNSSTSFARDLRVTTPFANMSLGLAVLLVCHPAMGSILLCLAEMPLFTASSLTSGARCLVSLFDQTPSCRRWTAGATWSTANCRSCPLMPASLPAWIAVPSRGAGLQGCRPAKLPSGQAPYQLRSCLCITRPTVCETSSCQGLSLAHLVEQRLLTARTISMYWRQF